jgi:uncharacterized protein
LFSWDPDKNRTNQKKHGVSLEAACMVFDDPFQLSRMDRIVDGEERWQTIGRAGDVLLLLVVHTYPEPGPGDLEIRIISARRANRKEREIYEEGAESHS